MDQGACLGARLFSLLATPPYFRISLVGVGLHCCQRLHVSLVRDGSANALTPSTLSSVDIGETQIHHSTIPLLHHSTNPSSEHFDVHVDRYMRFFQSTKIRHRRPKTESKRPHLYVPYPLCLGSQALCPRLLNMFHMNIGSSVLLVRAPGVVESLI